MLRFSAGGRVVIINPSSSSGAVSFVEVKDVKSLIADRYTRAEIRQLETFHGPLIAGQTPAHSVLLFVQRRIERVTATLRTSPPFEGATDCLLIWKLLAMIIEQEVWMSFYSYR